MEYYSFEKQEIKDNIMFLDIPISGNVLDFANQLEQKGFKKDSHFNGILNNKLYGVYDGCPCTLVIGHSVNNEVLSVFIRFHQSYEIMQMDESTKESFINMDNVDSLKYDFTKHKDYLEKTYSIIFEKPLKENSDSIVIPYGQSKWMGCGFIRIYPIRITNVSLIIEFRGNGDGTCINEKEIEEDI